MTGFMNFLKFVLGSPRRKLVKFLTKNRQVVIVIAEIVLNILLKNIPVKPEVAKKLRKYKRILIKLADASISIAQKGKLLKANGKLLLILAPLIPHIAASLKHEPLYQNVSHHRKR